MFLKSHFDIFDIEGLENRMAAIREHIQPIFNEIWLDFLPKIENILEVSMNIHIAKHIRRTANAPESTWSAVSMNKRGYKNEAHFQLGIWGDYVFLYLSMIDNPKDEARIAETLIKNINFIKNLPKDFVYSTDHTKKEVYKIGDNLEKDILRFRDVKKAEFEIGRVITSESPLWEDRNKAKQYLWETIEKLIPLHEEIYSGLS